MALLLIEIFSVLKLALEVYKAIKGVPHDRREAIKSHILENAAQVRRLAIQGAEAGDYSDLEAFINRTAR